LHCCAALVIYVGENATLFATLLRDKKSAHCDVSENSLL
jgi:hypothetical protein